jgi:hypothetical protein
MDGKRRSKSKGGPLDRAQASLSKKFVVRRDREVLFVGSDGLLVSKKGEKKLRLRFWTGAAPEYRTALVKALDTARIPYEVGPEYDLEHKGKKLDPKPALALVQGASGQETIGELERLPHVRACLLCKELLDQAATGDLEYQRRVYATVMGHVKQNPKADAPACQYAGCIHHEDVSREFSRKLLELGHGETPWKDARGVHVATIALIAKKDDHPKGWDFGKQDAESRHFKDISGDECGTLYVRLAPKKVTVHVWIEPAYPSKREAVDDPATMEDVLQTFAEKVSALREWTMKKYTDLKGLVEMDLDFGTK